jgi:hypothetical protein
LYIFLNDVVYYKNQFIAIFLSTVAILYSSFFYYQNRKLEAIVPSTYHIVLSQSCGYYKRASAVRISFGSEIYSIKLTRNECEKYPIGSKIALKYNKKWDYFYKPDGLKRDKSRMSFIAAILLISLIPWKIVKKLR